VNIDRAARAFLIFLPLAFNAFVFLLARLSDRANPVLNEIWDEAGTTTSRRLRP
jgi:hypothetical protein